MALDHPARILVNEDGTVFLDTQAGTTPASVFGFIGIVIDGGGVARAVLSDTSGRQVIVGAGAAGAPAGGVVTIQGVSGGVVVPVSDGGGSLTVDTPQLPSALVGGRLDANLGAWFGAITPTVGQKTMAASIPVTFASDQTALPVSQGTPPWAVKGTDADGANPTESPVLVAGQDGTDVQTILTETDGSVRVRDDFIDDRDKLVGVSFAKEAVAATTYYMGIDVSNTTDFHHTSGTAIHLSRSIGKALKTNAGSQWRAQLMVVLRIDGTDADLAILAQTSVNLEDTSTLSVPEQVVDLWPSLANLEVSGGVFTSFLTNAIELNVAAVNTGSAFEDAAGNTPAPAVGDMLIRAQNNSGGGTFSFAFGLEYFVE